MTKSELIERLASQQSHIPAKAVEDAVKEMLEHMASTLAQGERIEIRRFRQLFSALSSTSHRT
ncbi:integration host factor subunit beta [Klebsiella aerogenes]|nr:integration host factor subunit beta [Klebsiella aerogenes]